MPRNAKMIVVSETTIPGPAGAVVYVVDDANKIIGMNYCCPCGCGRWGFMGLPGYTFSDSTWQVVAGTVGSDDLTLQPSIGFARDKTTGQYHWHGYLRVGVFEEC